LDFTKLLEHDNECDDALQSLSTVKEESIEEQDKVDDASAVIPSIAPTSDLEPAKTSDDLQRMREQVLFSLKYVLGVELIVPSTDSFPYLGLIYEL
jgi:hypothetical protein